jgi:hypothetical protein
VKNRSTIAAPRTKRIPDMRADYKTRSTSQKISPKDSSHAAD